MSVLSTVKDSPGELHFWCPACKCAHRVWTQNSPGKPNWTWNNDMNKPTFSPSLRVQSGNAKGPTNCHSFIRDGKIQYLNDCTHSLKGKTVNLIDWDEV